MQDVTQQSVFVLSFPKTPALPNSYFWTWDHSCNWCLDDSGMQVGGCYNRYFKRPETFLEDYRRLTDLAAGLGVKGIVIWGFLRDSHGGVEYARQVADYAASRNIAILPGVGTTWYGGVYYEGSQKYSLRNFLKKNPDACMLDHEGKAVALAEEPGACLGHPLYQEWLAEAIEWLFREFAIGGVNLENGDFMTDYHPLVQAMRQNWPADDPEVFFHQGLSYNQALAAMSAHLEQKLCAYATYSGFQYTDSAIQNTGMGRKPPAMFNVLPHLGIAQWTLSGMLRQIPVQLSDFLDNGRPNAVYENPQWPRGLKPPSARSVGFVHQGSQWWGGAGRYGCIVSTIKEACLRAHESGLEGVSIHGEVTSRHIPYALNYLAFSHFIHHPEDSLRDFGRHTLGQVFDSEKTGEDYVEILAAWDAGTVNEQMKKAVASAARGFGSTVNNGQCENLQQYQRCRFWEWLHTVVTSPASCRLETGFAV